MNNEGNLAPTLLRAAGEVILIGVEGARVVQVGSERVEYIDSARRERVIDLQECATRWAWMTDQQRCWVPLPPVIRESINAANRCV